MAIHKIVKFGHPVLRVVTKPVLEVTPELVQLTDDMLETMHDANGVGLAANQIGLDMAIAVIAYKETVMRVFNPKIVEKKGTQRYGEGCLSVPEVDGDVKRFAEVTLEYINEKGELQRQHFTGHLARIVQHEVDHLNGVTIVNHLSLAVRELHKKVLERLKAETKADLADVLKAGS
jgi:peptide deformylase